MYSLLALIGVYVGQFVADWLSSLFGIPNPLDSPWDWGAAPGVLLDRLFILLFDTLLYLSALMVVVLRMIKPLVRAILE